MTRFEGQDLHLQTMLAENGDTVRRTATATGALKKLRETRQQLDRSLSTATDEKLAAVAELAKVLATEAPMLEALSQAIAALPEAQFPEPPDLEQLADSYGVDLTVQPAAKFVSGPTGLESELDSVGKKLRTAESTTREEVKAWIRPSQAILDHWGRQHAKWESDIEEKRQKLLAAGLTLQVGQLDQIRTQIKSTDLDIRKYEGWEKQHTAALQDRQGLLAELRRLRDRRHAERVKKSDALVAAMNESGPAATVSIKWTREGMRTELADRLGQLLDMHSPRKQRLANAVSAAELAEIVWAGDVKRLTAIGGEPFFSEPEVALKTLRSYVVLFELETMDIEDRPEIRVRFADERPGPGRPIAQPLSGSSGRWFSGLFSLRRATSRSFSISQRSSSTARSLRRRLFDTSTAPRSAGSRSSPLTIPTWLCSVTPNSLSRLRLKTGRRRSWARAQWTTTQHASR